MRQIQILLIVALAAIAGCRAQEEVAAPAQPGLPPTALPDVVTVETDSANNSITALANDIDLSGTGLTITAVMVDQTLPPTGGAVASTNGATVTFTPPAGFVGVVTLQYGIMDGTGATSTALIAVSVLPIALPPVALPDTAPVAQDSGPTDIDVLANDIDLAAGGLTLTGFTVTASIPVAAHTVAIVADQIRFTPAAAFVGAVLVDYTVTDANGETANGVLTVVVSPLVVGPGPVAVPDAEIVAQDSGATDLDVLANDVDPAGGGLTVSAPVVTASVPNAVHAVSVVGNQVRFTPAAGFAGSVVITYVATDTNLASANGVLTVVVSPLVPPAGPVPIPDLEIVTQDSGATDFDVLANDVDPAGGGLTLSAPTATASFPPAAHTLAVAGNQVRFTPAVGFAGIVVIGYTATDVNASNADGVLTVVVSPLNPPVGLVAIPDAATVAQDSGPTDVDVLANDVDFAGGGLTLSMVSVFSSQPAAVHTAAIVGNQVRFTPAAGFAGIVVVSYTATDINANTSNGLLNITVTPTPLALPPLALPDVDVASSGAGAQLFDVLVNDLDPAAGGLTLTLVGIDDAVPLAGAGTVAIVGNQVEYTPTLITYAGVVLISYTATDINGTTTVGELSLTVTP